MPRAYDGETKLKGSGSVDRLRSFGRRSCARYWPSPPEGLESAQVVGLGSTAPFLALFPSRRFRAAAKAISHLRSRDLPIWTRSSPSRTCSLRAKALARTIWYDGSATPSASCGARMFFTECSRRASRPRCYLEAPTSAGEDSRLCSISGSGFLERLAVGTADPAEIAVAARLVNLGHRLSRLSLGAPKLRFSRLMHGRTFRAWVERESAFLARALTRYQRPRRWVRSSSARLCQCS